MFAEIAAVIRIGQVRNILEFGGSDHTQWKLKLLGDGDRFVELTPGQARRIGDHGEGFFAQHVMRDARQKHRIHPARIRHQTGAVRAEQRAQIVELAQFHSANVPSPGSVVEFR